MLCWGSNERGQLGDGTTENRLEPTRVVDLALGAEVELVERPPGPRCVFQDTDGDGIEDAIEQRYGGDDGDGVPPSADLDSDEDGIPDAEEWGYDRCLELLEGCHGNPYVADSDRDGVPDGLESPEARCSRDSDGDGCGDLAKHEGACERPHLVVHVPNIVNHTRDHIGEGELRVVVTTVLADPTVEVEGADGLVVHTEAASYDDGEPFVAIRIAVEHDRRDVPPYLGTEVIRATFVVLDGGVEVMRGDLFIVLSSPLAI